MREFERTQERALENIDFERAYERAEKELDEEAIDIEEFASIEPFSPEGVEKDLAFVAKRETSFAEDRNPESMKAKKYATILEAVVYREGERSNWLGKNAFTIKTSRYDDIVNGVDSVVEFRRPEKDPDHLALAVDVTYSNSISEKLERIKEEIDSGKLSEVKYFVSEEAGLPHQSLENVPRVILATTMEMVSELTELWMEKDNNALAEHRIQLLMLDQMLMQLKKFEGYARSLGEEKKEIADRFSEATQIISEIAKSKKDLRAKLGRHHISEEVLFAMRRELDSIFSI